MAEQKIMQNIMLIDIFYPPGSYYETSDPDFDPNVSWGGAWELEAEGLVHIGAGENYLIGGTGGEKVHTLSQSEIPRYGIGFIPTNVPGQHGQWSNAGVVAAGGATPKSQGKAAASLAGSASNTTPQYGWNINTNGGGQAHNNMQPYKVVNRWHRIR